MNQRIQELAEQAGMYIVDDEFSTYGKFAEKFAELIVRECADVGSKFSLAHPEAIRYQIKKHFGVKE